MRLRTAVDATGLALSAPPDRRGGTAWVVEQVQQRGDGDGGTRFVQDDGDADNFLRDVVTGKLM